MTRITSLSAVAALLGSIAVAAPVSAAPLSYVFTTSTVGAQSFTFNVDSNPVVSLVSPFQFTARVQNVTVNGITRSDITSFDFFSAAATGGIASNSVGSYLGPQLFSGTTSVPTLLTGQFTLTGGPFGATGNLSVAPFIAAVPEPGAWAMTIVGLGLAGSALRRRRTVTRVAYAA